MFGRETLKEFMRGEQESLKEFMHSEQEKTLRALEETREFNREILLRNEKVYTSAIAEMEKMGRQIEENTARTKAGTQAILRLLGRFDDGGGAAA